MAILLIAYVVITVSLGGIYYQEIQFDHWLSGGLFGFVAGASFYFVILVPLFELRSEVVSLFEVKRLLRNADNIIE